MKKLLHILIINCSLLITHCYSQWIQQTVPVSKPITGIKFIDSLKGWACTSYGTPADTAYILYTSNGGTNWLVQLAAYNINFTDINILNSQTGYVSGADNNIGLYKLFSTSNGGISWTSVTMVPNMNIADMQFLNKDSAWECGNSIGPDVRTTTDGGNTWIVKTSGIAQATQKIFFLDYNTGFCGANFNLYKTTNAGLNWVLNNNFSQSIESMYFKDENTGWLGLSPDVSAKVAYTTNGGINWNLQSLQPYLFNITDIYFTNNQTGWGGVAFNKIYKTTNAGLNRGYQNNTQGSNRISFIDTSRGWSGWNGISYTTNGGGPITYVGINNISSEVPNTFKLYQNYPNPFNPETNIKYQITTSSYVKLSIYDILGREIETLVNENQKAGTYLVDWNSEGYSSGMYFYKLIADGYSETKKMLMIK